MVLRNIHLNKLHARYFFPEITRRTEAFRNSHPDANLISMGIGDTTEPIPSFIVQQMAEEARLLGTLEGYQGYGPEEGNALLRQLISQELYGGRFGANEIAVSDGINPDIGRFQVLFGSGVTIAVQDPSYPVYVDTAVILGQTGSYHAIKRQYEKIIYMPCLPQNDFFPLLDEIPRTDLIYFCSPNNPTGAVATHAQLAKLVSMAKRNRSIILYDTAYSAYIQDDTLPRSIYEVPGAEEVAIELGSFSKMAGFTGVRLGWNVVPKQLMYDTGESILSDWHRVYATFFNGASHIAQAGGMAVLQPEGRKEIQQLVRAYMENAALLSETFEKGGYESYGGHHAPYVWVRFPGMNSWEAFDYLLQRCQVICAPGSGFGPAGEGFLRFSAFAHRTQIEEACQRLVQL